MTDVSAIPVIDIAALVANDDHIRSVADALRDACSEHGFFYIVNHGIAEDLCERLEQLSRQFFAQDHDTKMTIRMERGGRAWRGYFPVGAELTSGQPDQKEGLYFGAELPDDHPKVQAGIPLHGRNLFPNLSGFRDTALDYMNALTNLGHHLMRGLAVSLGLEPSYFADRYTTDPLILFRIFHYPPLPDSQSKSPTWSVGEHTDYGLLTILQQDDTGGLQIKSRGQWLDAPPLPASFVCNLGDMLDRMTGGLYRSTPHRVRNPGNTGRLSFPFFFDPNWDAAVQALPTNMPISDDHQERWDQASVHDFHGTYGDYVLQKVAKVFPELSRARQQ